MMAQNHKGTREVCFYDFALLQEIEAGRVWETIVSHFCCGGNSETEELSAIGGGSPIGEAEKPT